MFFSLIDTHGDMIIFFEVRRLLTMLVSCDLVYSKLSTGIRPYSNNIWYIFYEFGEMIVISFDRAPCHQVVPC